MLSSGGVLQHWCPCPAAWPVALSLGAVLWFQVVSYSLVLCLVVLCWCVVLCCRALLSFFLLLLFFAFAHYLKHHCKIQNKTNFFPLKKFDTTEHTHVGRQQDLCNIGLTYTLTADLNGNVVDIGLESLVVDGVPPTAVRLS